MIERKAKMGRVTNKALLEEVSYIRGKIDAEEKFAKEHRGWEVSQMQKIEEKIDLQNGRLRKTEKSVSWLQGVAGLFSIILDADHLLQLLEIEMIPRMAHSLLFILIVIVVMMLLFGRKDLRLIAVSIAAVFSHMSFDTILGGSTEFPVLAPFTSQFFTFSGIDWIVFEVIAVAVILTASVIVKKNYSRYNFKQKFYSF